jgi:hypothetical protein
VPSTSIDADTAFGGRGGGFGHHAGSEKFDTVRSLCQLVLPTAWAPPRMENGVVRMVLLVGLLAAVGAVLAAGARPATTLSFTVKTKQGPTSMHPHPPVGAVGDRFDSSLRLVNGPFPQLGRRAHAVVGRMAFTYTIRRQCTSFRRRCVATADFDTVTTLPGGTVIANGRGISIAHPMIDIPVVGGTGRYRGVRGSVAISPTSSKVSTYRLTLP